MRTQLASNSVLRGPIAGGQSSAYPNKHYRRDRRADVRERCESDTARSRTAQVEGMIAALERMVNALNVAIQDEQVKSGVHDPAQFDYPTLATALIKRRNNVMRSIDLLRREFMEPERVV
jgi:hypothetical protein